MQRFTNWTMGLAISAALFGGAELCRAAVDFSDISLPPNSYQDNAGGGDFVSGGAHFNNNFDSTFDSWSGWSVSNLKNVNTTLPPGANDYDPPYEFSAYNLPSGGSPNPTAPNYGVAYDYAPGVSTIVLPAGTRPVSADITNTTYAAISMLHGDGFAKQFGGASGNDADWFLLTITGLDNLGNPLAAGPVPFYLADYRFANNAQDYVVSHWTTVDLSSLAGAHSLSFGLSSSDNGAFGMNTPATFALDNLVLAAVPEPSTGLLALGGLLGVVGGRLVRRARRSSATVRCWCVTPLPIGGDVG